MTQQHTLRPGLNLIVDLDNAPLADIYVVFTVNMVSTNVGTFP
jgi:hypothetical protein